MKKSWAYQKDRYSQVNIKFNMSDDFDARLYFYLMKQNNVTAFIKSCIEFEMVKDAWEGKD